MKEFEIVELSNEEIEDVNGGVLNVILALAVVDAFIWGYKYVNSGF